MITPSTLSFLEGVSRNNDRDWFQKHKHEYEAARENALSFTAEVIKGLAKSDPLVPADLSPRDCLMRIYRDVRFSKDKSPYKTNFGIALSANGKNFKGPGYYIHIQPGKSFIAAGAWDPAPDELKAIRQEIDYNSGDWNEIITNPDFIAAFGSPDMENALRTAPKGYPSDHPAIQWLKLKSFTVSKKIDDKDLCGPKSAAIVTGLFEKLYPFIVFLRNAIS